MTYCCDNFKELVDHEIFRVKWNEKITRRLYYELIYNYYYSPYPDDPGAGTESYDSKRMYNCPFCGVQLKMT